MKNKYAAKNLISLSERTVKKILPNFFDELKLYSFNDSSLFDSQHTKKYATKRFKRQKTDTFANLYTFLA